MATEVIICLEFESDDISDSEVYNYLVELIEDRSLNWDETIKEKDNAE